MVTFDKSLTFEAKHKKEISKFAGDGFVDGCCYENSEGEKRFIVWTNYTVGVNGPMVKACSGGETIIHFHEDDKRGSCSIAEWYKWLGSKWQLAKVEEKPKEKTAVEKAAEVKKAEFDKGAVKTFEYPKPKKGPQWASPKKTKKP